MARARFCWETFAQIRRASRLGLVCCMLGALPAAAGFVGHGSDSDSDSGGPQFKLKRRPARLVRLSPVGAQMLSLLLLLFLLICSPRFTSVRLSSVRLGFARPGSVGFGFVRASSIRAI